MADTNSNSLRWSGLRDRVVAFGKTTIAANPARVEPATPARKHPFNAVRELPSRILQLFELSRWVPRIDIYEDETALHLAADIPGTKRDELSIRVAGDQLVVSGRRAAVWPAGGRVRRRERNFGHFVRKFTLPDRAEVEAITSELQDGVLVISVPKKPLVREIAIKDPAAAS